MPTPNSSVTPQTVNIPVGGLLLAANTAKDGTGTMLPVFVAGTTGGAIPNKLQVCYTGLATATVLRLFLNNGGSNATASNNFLWKTVSIPACTTFNETTSPGDIDIDLPDSLPSGWKVLACIGTTVANALALVAPGAGDF